MLYTMVLLLSLSTNQLHTFQCYAMDLPTVVITGIPCAKASKTTIPKFSLKVGSTNKLHLFNKSSFALPVTEPLNSKNEFNFNVLILSSTTFW